MTELLISVEFPFRFSPSFHFALVLSRDLFESRRDLTAPIDLRSAPLLTSSFLAFLDSLYALFDSVLLDENSAGF
ncbi:hypothetical protein GYH30_018160 [Glycine max]|uniref:Uncharacterized protein n=1 Tax=Glycine max TaxID=3847 RepID=A0A0R0J2A0_SOYBN|nr:hypothetical protein GYH30_018160 [Glycine max]